MSFGRTMNPEYTVILFYWYVDVEDVAGLVASQRQLMGKLNLQGRVRVAIEGINGTVCGSADSIASYETATRAALGAKDGDIDFKRSTSTEPAFQGVNVRAVEEIVTLGLPPGTPGAPCFRSAARRLSPQAYHSRLCARECSSRSVVVVDVRNAYESAIGHFRGALLPDLRQFSEFPDWARSVSECLRGAAEILLYCTGGVRCERASAFLVENLGVERDRVYQLEGGIVRYLDAFDDGGGQWKGKNLTFDSRIAVQGSREIVGKCVECAKEWDDYHVGARCAYCRRRLVVCEDCEGVVRLCSKCQNLYEEEKREPCHMKGSIGRLSKMEAALEKARTLTTIHRGQSRCASTAPG